MIKVELVSDFNSPTGYSTHARDLITSMLAVPDIDLKLRSHKADRATVSLPPEIIEKYTELMTKEWTKPDVRIHFEIPNFFVFEKDVYTIGFMQWETTRVPWGTMDGLTAWNWPERMNMCDEIWTSCEEARKAFARSGVQVPVHIIPGPIDTDFFRPDQPELKIRLLTSNEDGSYIPREQRRKVIGFMGAWNKRKNIEDWLVWMYTQWPLKEVAGLLKTSVGTIGEGDQRSRVGSRIQELRRLAQMTTGAEIFYLCEKLTDLEIARFYQTPDIYVSFARGEGLCLPALQAMASGCLVMHTNWGATTDYLTRDVGFPIAFQLEPVFGMEYKPYWGDQWWARADLHQATQVTKKIFQAMDKDPHSFDELRQKARDLVVSRSSIPAITKLLTQRFEDIGKCSTPEPEEIEDVGADTGADEQGTAAAGDQRTQRT